MTMNKLKMVMVRMNKKVKVVFNQGHGHGSSASGPSWPPRNDINVVGHVPAMLVLIPCD